MTCRESTGHGDGDGFRAGRGTEFGKASLELKLDTSVVPEVLAEGVPHVRGRQ